MVNHIRTLLMNVQGQEGFRGDIPGEEYIPANYKQRELPQSMKLARQSLFGTTPDRLFLNYRLFQVMSLLHKSPLEEYLYADDSRVTYWPPANPGYFDSVFGTTISPTSSSLYVTGTPIADDNVGKTTWDVTVSADGSEVQLTGAQDATYDLGTGLNGPFRLPGGVSLFVQGQHSGTHYITIKGRPQSNLADVLSSTANNLGSGLAWVFQEPLQEPYLSLYNVWAKHPYTLYQYAALLIAWALRTDTLPRI